MTLSSHHSSLYFKASKNKLYNQGKLSLYLNIYKESIFNLFSDDKDDQPVLGTAPVQPFPPLQEHGGERKQP